MSRSARTLLEGILEGIGRIESYVVGVTKADFESDTEKQDALVRRLEIIGQAVKVESPPRTGPGRMRVLRELGLHPKVGWSEAPEADIGKDELGVQSVVRRRMEPARHGASSRRMRSP